MGPHRHFSFCVKASTTAPAIAAPSVVAVPRPSSSSATRLRAVARFSAAAVSVSSTRNVLCRHTQLGYQKGCQTADARGIASAICRLRAVLLLSAAAVSVSSTRNVHCRHTLGVRDLYLSTATRLRAVVLFSAAAVSVSSTRNVLCKRTAQEWEIAADQGAYGDA